MILDDLIFDLPKELIAQRPVSPRDNAKLLVYNRADKTITDSVFKYLPSFLPENTTLVLNETKVDKCRMKFDGLEVFLLETYNDKTAKAMVWPGKKFKLGSVVNLTKDVHAEVIDIDDNGHRTLEFNVSLDSPSLDKYKLTPLPPYVKQDETLSDEYQTVYAKTDGSKAAPTAGLHFTGELLDKIKQAHPVVEVTLDVGLGTFAPVTEENVTNRKLHSETFSLTQEAASQLNGSEHITAVGTTTTRVLESVKRKHGQFIAVQNEATDIFIQPDDDMVSIDALITNFHLPSTSLLMMVSALTGTDELMRIYKHAIDKKYRFYSFGDAMLII